MLHDVDGILSYELLHEPWVGDHVGDPDLLLGLEIMWEIQICSSSEALLRGDPSGSITMRAFVRAVDPRTPVLYSLPRSPLPRSPLPRSPLPRSSLPRQRRAMRRVGFESEPMEFHVYCIEGTDSVGPATPQ